MTVKVKNHGKVGNKGDQGLLRKALWLHDSFIVSLFSWHSGGLVSGMADGMEGSIYCCTTSGNWKVIFQHNAMKSEVQIQDTTSALELIEIIAVLELDTIPISIEAPVLEKLSKRQKHRRVIVKP
jgi:hypothetical protein